MQRYREQETSTARRKLASKPRKRAARADSGDLLRRQHALIHPREATPAALFGLQQVIGNRAVQRLLDEHAQREQAKPDDGKLSADVQAEIQRERGGGHPLDRAANAQLGPKLGDDFSGVRVHTDARADRLNRALNAKAFTLGNDVFFSRDSYRPSSTTGQRLLAHELSHVAQQRGAAGPGRQSALRVGLGAERYEHEAQRASTHAFSADQVGTPAAANLTPQRGALSSAPASIQRLVEDDATKQARTDPKSKSPGLEILASDPKLKDKRDSRNLLQPPLSPELFYSDDRSVAIDPSAKDAKEFYATQDVIDAANVQLRAHGSAVALGAEGRTYITEGVRNFRLFKVTPRIIDNSSSDSRGAEEMRFGTHVSIALAQLVFGNMTANYHPEAFAGWRERFLKGKLRTMPIKTLVNYIALVMDTSDVDMAKAMHKSSDIAGQVKGFGKLSKEKLEVVADMLGIDRRARAKIFVEDNSIYGAKMHSAKRASADDYRFSGPTAASRDEHEHVVLENYNRGTNINKVKYKLFDQMQMKNKDVLTAKVVELKHEMDAADKELQNSRNSRSTGAAEKKKAQDRPRGVPNSRYMNFVVQKKIQMKRDAGQKLKAIYQQARDNEGKSSGDAEKAIKQTVDSPPTKGWSFKMVSSNKASRSISSPPKTAAAPTVAPKASVS